MYGSRNAVQGCYTQGNTYEEVLANLRDALQLLDAMLLAVPRGEPRCG